MSRIQEFDFSVDLLKAILWQYNDAEKLQSILQQKQDWYTINQTQFWEDWRRDVFDLRTANDFGLSVWSIILDIPLGVDTGAPENTNLAYGFGQYHKNYNNGNFKTSGSSFVTLTTDQKRIVLQLRYFQLITKGAVPEINEFLHYILPSIGTDAYVLDTYDMSLAFYIFTSAPPSQLQFVLQYYDLLPRPAGVGVGYAIVSRVVFGFEEYHTNFDNGNFNN